MEILWTRSDRIGSRVIRDVTGEPCSHVALSTGDYVVHSTFTGVEVESLHTFGRDNEIVFRKWIANDYPALMRLLGIHGNSGYDYGAFLYLGLKLLLRRVGVKLPKRNLWQSTGMYLCTEWVTKYINGEEDSLVTPYQLYQRLTERSN